MASGIKHVLVITCCLSLVVLVTSASSPEILLANSLLADYKTRGIQDRPVGNNTGALDVGFSLKLLQILAINEKEEMLTSRVIEKYEWVDIYLKWKPAEHGEVEQVRLPVDQIWTPDFILANGIDSPKILRPSPALVSSTGVVQWSSTRVIKTTCVVDVSNFPFDTQVCHFNFTSLTLDGSKLNPIFLRDAAFIDLSVVVPTHDWKVIKTPATKATGNLTSEDPVFPSLDYELWIKRTSGVFTFVLVVPTILLMMLTLMMFILPCPGREHVGLTLNLSYLVLLLLLHAETPQATAELPRIGLFVALHMCIIILCIFTSMYLASLIASAKNGKPVPQLIHQFWIVFLGRVLCVRDCPNKCGECCTKDPEEPNLYSGLRQDEPQVDGKQRIPSTQETSLDQSGLQGLMNEVHDISHKIQHHDEVKEEEGRKIKVVDQWTLLAAVIDRIMLVLYLIFAFFALVFIFPWP